MFWSVRRLEPLLGSAAVLAVVALQQALPVSAQFARPVWTTVPAPGVSLPSSSSAPALEPIPPLTASVKLWPSPSLNPGVPSAFIANWGDVFLATAAGTASDVRNNVDGSWIAGFGLGDASRVVALEVSAGCGSVKNFCSNGGFGLRMSRLLINQPTARVALAAGWQNGIQWGNEGRQDNIYTATLSYAVPLRPGSTFAQTLQLNAGAGNSSFAPYAATDSESKIGGFGSVGL